MSSDTRFPFLGRPIVITPSRSRLSGRAPSPLGQQAAWPGSDAAAAVAAERSPGAPGALASAQRPPPDDCSQPAKPFFEGITYYINNALELLRVCCNGI